MAPPRSTGTAMIIRGLYRHRCHHYHHPALSPPFAVAHYDLDGRQDILSLSHIGRWRQRIDLHI